MKSATKTCPRCGAVLPWISRKGQAFIRGHGNACLYFCDKTCKEEWLYFNKCTDEFPPLLGDLLDEGMRLLHASEMDE